jgi:hypothetical protein
MRRILKRESWTNNLIFYKVMASSWIEMYLKDQKRKAQVTNTHRNLVAAVDASREGRRLEQEQQEAAFRPVTNEIKHAQDVISEKLNFEPLKAELEKIQSNTMPLAHELEKMHHYVTNEKYFDMEPTIALMNKYKLPHPSEMHSYDKEKILEILTKTTRSLGGKKANSAGEQREEIDKELVMLKKYRQMVQSSTFGSGLKYYKHPDELKNRLKVLVGEMRAGNVSDEIQNESVEVIDRLRLDNVITAVEQKALYEKVYSF